MPLRDCLAILSVYSPLPQAIEMQQLITQSTLPCRENAHLGVALGSRQGLN